MPPDAPNPPAPLDGPQPDDAAPEAPPFPKLGILAGGGNLPAMLYQARIADGGEAHIIAFPGFTDKETAEVAGDHHRWIDLASINHIVRELQENGCTDLVMAGHIRRRISVHGLKPDVRGSGLLPAIAKARGADAVIRIIVAELEKDGFHLIGADEIMKDLLGAPGALGTVEPGPEHWPDIRAAAAAALEIGAADQGQAAVARGGAVVGLEGEGGTDSLLWEVTPEDVQQAALAEAAAAAEAELMAEAAAAAEAERMDEAEDEGETGEDAGQAAAEDEADAEAEEPAGEGDLPEAPPAAEEEQPAAEAAEPPGEGDLSEASRAAEDDRPEQDAEQEAEAEPVVLSGVLVKRPKPQQERRADLPAIGPQTVWAARRAGLAGIAVEASGTLIIGKIATAAAADEAGLFIYCFEPGELDTPA